MFITSVRSEATADRSPWGQFWFQPIGSRTSSGVRVTSASSMNLPAVLSCVRVLAESFAIMPFMLYQPKASGRGREKVRWHWLYKLLAKRPNRFQTPYEFKLMLMGHLALRGNAFCQITANSKGEIVELLPLHPDRMQIEMLTNGSYRYFYTDEQGKSHTYARQEIWHLRGMSDDGYMGMSLVQLAREAIGEGLAMQSYSSRFFANDARPGGGWIEYPGSFANTETKRKFRDGWQELQGGANRGKVAVLEKGMKFHEVGIKNSDAQFFEARGDKRREIAGVFRVPAHKINDLDRATNNNIEHQSIEFWTDTMLPWANMWESSISFFLLGPDSDLEPDFDHVTMMRGDGKSRAERIARLVLAGVMLRNEGREEEGLDPIEGLDEPMQPANMMTLEQAEKGGTQPAKPAGPGDEAGADRLDALAAAAAQRVARKEGEMFARAVGDRAALGVAYGKHSSFVAGALGVSQAQARDYCEAQLATIDAEPAISAQALEDLANFRLNSLARGEEQRPVDQVAHAVNRMANAVAAQPATVVNVAAPNVSVAAPVVENHLPAAEVHVAAPVVNVTTPEPHVSVNVEAPQISVTTPAPVVNVEAPNVTVNNEAAAAPNVSVNVEAAKTKQADRPWPVRTEVLKRDGEGRADIFETTPID